VAAVDSSCRKIGGPLTNDGWQSTWRNFLTNVIHEGLMERDNWFCLHDMSRQILDIYDQSIPSVNIPD
jgi:hypothetical protein